MIPMNCRARGFTLVELIVVMVVVGVLAGVLVTFFRPAMQNYLAVGRRAELTDLADTAMRRMTRDIRLSVPNSVRLLNNGAIEMMPSSMGGRYRTAADSSWDAKEPTPSRPLDITRSVSAFDVLTPMPVLPADGDFVVIGNMDSSEIYAAASPTRTALASAVRPPAPTDASSMPVGTARITFTPEARFPAGYDGGRFFIVPAAQGAVAYVCQGVTPAGGGVLYRVSSYAFKPALDVPATAGAAILARRVSACQFGYTPGTTQERGLATIVLSLTDGDETVTLSYSTHVSNVP